MIALSFADVLALFVLAFTLLLLFDRQSLLREMSRTRREVKALRKALLVQGKPAKRKVIPPWLRQKVIERCEYQCQYCGSYGDEQNGPDGLPWHVDHVVAVKNGGPTHEGNLTLSCETCNLSKGIQSAAQFTSLAIEHKSDISEPSVNDAEIKSQESANIPSVVLRSRQPTPEQAAEMREMYTSGATKTEICVHYFGYKDGIAWQYMLDALEGRL